MKTWKLVSGILSIILFALVAFQSCAAGMSNALEENGEVSGSAGIIALIIIFGLAALVGFAMHGSYSDLTIWAGWCLINAVLAAAALFRGGRKQNS